MKGVLPWFAMGPGWLRIFAQLVFVAAPGLAHSLIAKKGDEYENGLTAR